MRGKFATALVVMLTVFGLMAPSAEAQRLLFQNAGADGINPPSASNVLTCGIYQSGTAVSAAAPLAVTGTVTAVTTVGTITNPVKVMGVNGTTLVTAANPLAIAPYIAGAVNSATNGTFTNLLQSNAVVSPTNAVPVQVMTSTKATYSTVVAPYTPVATPTDIFILPGSASKTIKILRVAITQTQTTTGVNQWFLIKRSTANSGGTSGATTVVPLDSASSAGTAAPLKYTGNPTTGTPVGNIRICDVVSPKVDSVSSGYHVIYDSTDRVNGQPITLRGVAEGLALNFNGAAVPSGLAVGAEITYTEE